MTKTPTIAFLTLGCPKNEVDSDNMRASVLSSAYSLTDDFSEADVIVLNTCGFIVEAVEESVAFALELAEWRDRAPGRFLVLAGCLVSRYGDELSEALPEVDAVVALSAESRLLERLELLTGVPANPRRSRSRTLPGASAYLRISDGCSNLCAYCTIPSIRGPYRSRPLPEIVDEAVMLVDGGARELVLIGQDTSAWGRDLHEDQTLSDVLREVAAIPELRWLRLMYVQPGGITADLLDTMARLDKVVPYLDIPLQHCSPSILKAMNRNGSPEEFLELIDSIRSIIPSAILRSTFIAGYPGETEADLDLLIGFLKIADLDYAGVFAFSPEDGTPAAALNGQLPAEERTARANRVRETADAVGTDRLTRLVGETVEVLAEGLDEDGSYVGRWSGQAPEVDGLTYLDRELETGSFVRCRVLEACGYDLEVEVLE